MQLPTIPKIGPLSKKRKITVAGAGAAAAAAVVLTVTGLQATGGSAVAVGDPAGVSATTGHQVKNLDAKTDSAAQRALADHATAQKKAGAKKAPATAAKPAQPKAGTKKTSAPAPAKKAAPHAAPAKKAAPAAAGPAAKPATTSHRVLVKAAPKAPVKAVKPVKPVARAAVKPVAKPAVEAVVKPVAKPVVKAPAPAPAKPIAVAPAAVTYPNTLDGWIRQSLAIMHEKGIPGSYNGIYRNIIRESSGNPNAINLWDINAQNGIPSKGLLQVIPPTFQEYHVAGTSWNIYDPVANITAACNYAAARYGSMDNVYSAY
ncbi:Transglycosylase SLT domain-containing protein [Streptomyces sp. DvalAA-14]|uniref:transglycosylase SLT domain-containing protein n=1 Tax=unclassified Streptomyces TaxID=2593676 RepID=UPI00081AEF9D|nr:MULTISPECIES: transglycosylase SLT domain-containing protein [unclassified Streptomyces]MYS22736.1 transglycosylase SLT domain-containing protein [Streptomyces sp. SID4948]SCE21566.1 Transglycosylase SLT domain-containing protein [Streptomyces sp. DvalAA-14]